MPTKEQRKIVNEVQSRENYRNGLYRKMMLGVQDITAEANDSYVSFMKLQADTADKLLLEAKEAGKNLFDEQLLRELGTAVKKVTGPIPPKETREDVAINSLFSAVIVGATIGVWLFIAGGQFWFGFFFGFITRLLLLRMYPATIRVRMRKSNSPRFVLKDFLFSATVVYLALALVVLLVKNFLV